MKNTKQTKKLATNGHVPTGTSTQAEGVPFDAGVDEAKKILANLEKVSDAGHLRIGEIADKLETKHNDRTLAEFAKRTGKSPSCVKRWRSVYRAGETPKLGPRGPN